MTLMLAFSANVLSLKYPWTQSIYVPLQELISAAIPKFMKAFDALSSPRKISNGQNQLIRLIYMLLKKVKYDTSMLIFFGFGQWLEIFNFLLPFLEDEGGQTRLAREVRSVGSYKFPRFHEKLTQKLLPFSPLCNLL